MRPEGGQGGGEVGGRGGEELDGLAGDRVEEVQRVGVEGLAAEEHGGGVGVVEAQEVAQGEGGPARIRLVGQDRVADVGEVDADLVGPPGPGLAADEGEASEAFEDFVEGGCLLAAVVEGSDGDLLAVGRVEAEGLLDVVGVARGGPVDQGEVFLADRPGFELAGELAVGPVVLGDDQEARGVAVEPVDDPRPVLAADGGERVEVELEGVDQRPGPVPLGRLSTTVNAASS